MTKQEAIEKTRALLETLRDMPDDDSIVILSAVLKYDNKTDVQLYKGLEDVSDAFSSDVVEFQSDEEFQWLGIETESAKIFQLVSYDEE